MTLKTVEEHDEEVRRARDSAKSTGVSCPRCGSELKESGVVMMSFPPRRGVACDCGYVGSVL